MPGAFLDLLPGLLDLGVLGLDVAVLRGQQRRLVLQLGVGPLQLDLLILQLFGPRLELGGEPLRLLEQCIGARVGDDRVEVDPEGLGQLLEEVGLHRAERVERGELDDAEHLVLEQDRQHGQVRRRCLAEPGGDLDVAPGQIRDHDRPLALGDLADQRLAQPVLGRRGLVRPQPVAGDQPQLGVAARRLGQEERAVLRADQRDQLVHDQLGHHGQVPVALHHPRDLGQVGLQPVLLLVGPDGLAQRWTIALMLSLSSATSPCASTEIDRVRSP